MVFNLAKNHKNRLHGLPTVLHSNQQRKIGGDFPVRFKMELVLGDISGGFPVIQSEIAQVHVF
jgi:hypothetical protein